jgi:hypothetical protein
VVQEEEARQERHHGRGGREVRIDSEVLLLRRRLNLPFYSYTTAPTITLGRQGGHPLGEYTGATMLDIGY